MGQATHSAINVTKALKGISAIGKKDYMNVELSGGSKMLSQGDVLQANLDRGIIAKFYHEDQFTRDMLAGTTLNSPSAVGRLANRLAGSKYEVHG